MQRDCKRFLYPIYIQVLSCTSSEQCVLGAGCPKCCEECSYHENSAPWPPDQKDTGSPPLPGMKANQKVKCVKTKSPRNKRTFRCSLGAPERLLRGIHTGDELEFVPNKVDELIYISVAIRLLSANSSPVRIGPNPPPRTAEQQMLWEFREFSAQAEYRRRKIRQSLESCVFREHCNTTRPRDQWRRDVTVKGDAQPVSLELLHSATDALNSELLKGHIVDSSFQCLSVRVNMNKYCGEER